MNKSHRKIWTKTINTLILLFLIIYVECEGDSECNTRLTCDNIRCGENQQCAPCGQNACNTYSCFNRDGSTVKCKLDCTATRPACVCKPYFYRTNESSPCVPLSCPSGTTTPIPKTTKIPSSTPCSTIKPTSPTSTTKVPNTLSCDNIKCPINQTCAACGQNVCNTYNCLNPDGSKLKCLYKCPQLNPTCICKPNFYRVNASSPCLPLSCTASTTSTSIAETQAHATTNASETSSLPLPSNITCNSIKCAENEECAACGQNACNSYSCFNPNGSKFNCLYKCPQLNPTCICKPYFYRPNSTGPCVPLKCPQ